MIKYDDDTYLIIPACNIDSRQQEMDHIAEWSKRNNLALNWSKIVEIVFSDMQQKETFRGTAAPDARNSSRQIFEGARCYHLEQAVSNEYNIIISSCARSLP